MFSPSRLAPGYPLALLVASAVLLASGWLDPAHAAPGGGRDVLAAPAVSDKEFRVAFGKQTASVLKRLRRFNATVKLFEPNVAAFREFSVLAVDSQRAAAKLDKAITAARQALKRSKPAGKAARRARGEALRAIDVQLVIAAARLEPHYEELVRAGEANLAANDVEQLLKDTRRTIERYRTKTLSAFRLLRKANRRLRAFSVKRLNRALAKATPAKLGKIPVVRCGVAWEGQWARVEHAGTMTLSQQGATVTGTYDWSGGGTVNGTVANRTLKADWSDQVGSGTLTVRLGAGERSFAGSFEGKRPDGGLLAGSIGGTRIGPSPCN